LQLSGSARQLPVLQERPVSARFDLLNAPLLGSFLRWRNARVALQLPLALLAAILIVDGLRGPQIAAVNLAGVLPWIHWRGLLILTLLVAGNVFCMACPFTLPRRLARSWLGLGRVWPRPLRTKWLAVGLVAVFLWAYETFSLWNSPRWTAWIAIGYFVTAFAVDGLFPAGTFCKYVCPIGQFNFVQSLVSPLEVQVRSPSICVSCTTHECIRGSQAVPGCQSRLFQPHKSSNLDCTFCLDCVHACPHGNVGLLAVVPGRELWRDTFRSGIGRFARRTDLAALVVVLVFGALSNAAGMVGPVLEWEDRVRSRMGGVPPWMMPSLFAVLSLIVVPVVAVGLTATLSRRWGGIAASPIDVATRFSYALVPLGFAMWLSHYSFHFLTSWETALPASQRVLQDLGWRFLGEPRYQCACCRPVGDWLLELQILFLDAGLLMSLYAGYRIALGQSASFTRALAAFGPWSFLIVLLFTAAVWIVFQPMQMRGTLPGSA
jgi:polyferredoxin